MKVLLCIALAISAVSANIVCHNGNVGVRFPAPLPTQYLICEWAGFPPTLMNCAPGTYFVEYLQGCDAGHIGGDDGGAGGGGDNGNGGGGDNGGGNNTPCPPCPPIQDTTTTTTAPVTTTTTPAPITTTTTPAPITTTTPTAPIQTPCPPCEPIFDSGEKETENPGNPEIPETACPDNGFICTSFGGHMYTNPFNPATYWQCPVIGQCSHLRPCAPGTVFVEERQICDWP